MKRRSFFAALSALCAAPAVAMLPKPAPVQLLPDTGALAAFSRRMANLTRYEWAEWNSAQMVASIFDPPMTHDEIVDLFEGDAREFTRP